MFGKAACKLRLTPSESIVMFEFHWLYSPFVEMCLHL